MAISDGAHWLDKEDLQTHFHRHFDSALAVQIGMYHAHPVYLTQHRLRRRVLVIEPLAKSEPLRTSHVLAWFLLDGDTAQRSFVIFDAQPNLKALCASKLSTTHMVFDISLQSPQQGLHYNPLFHIPLLDPLTATTLEESTAQQENAADLVVEALIQQARYSHVYQLSDLRLEHDIRELLLASILHLRTTDPFAPFSRLYTMQLDRRALLLDLAASPSTRAREIAMRILPQDQDYLDNRLWPSLSAITGFLDDPVVKKTTGSNDIDFTYLQRKPAVLFYTPPLLRGERFVTLNTIFFTQLCSTYTRSSPDDEDEQHMYFICNEFLKDMRLPGFNDYMRMLQYHGVAVVVAESSVSRVGFPADTARAGSAEHSAHTRIEQFSEICDTHIVLPGVDFSDCQRYAALCGATNKIVRRETAQGFRDVHEPLLAPEELERLALGEALLYCHDGDPAIITLRDSADLANASSITAPNQSPFNQQPCFDELTLAELKGSNTPSTTAAVRSLHEQLEQSIWQSSQPLDKQVDKDQHD